MSLKDYIIRYIQEKFKYLPSAVYLALICIAMYIFVCLLRYLFTMREVSQADERRKKIVGKIWHMLFCGTFVAYMYTLIMIVYYSREPGSRTGIADIDAFKRKLEKHLGERFRVLDRYEQQADTFRIMKIEKFISYLFLTF